MEQPKEESAGHKEVKIPESELDRRADIIVAAEEIKTDKHAYRQVLEHIEKRGKSYMRISDLRNKLAEGELEDNEIKDS